MLYRRHSLFSSPVSLLLSSTVPTVTKLNNTAQKYAWGKPVPNSGSMANDPGYSAALN